MNYFSKKFNFEKTSNPLTDNLDTIKKNKEIIDLTISNPTLVDIEYNFNLNSLFVQKIKDFYYPNPKGSLLSRKAIQSYYTSRGKSINLDQLFLTTGSSESLSFVLKLIADPGDEILIPSPGYPIYEYVGILENVNIKKYNLYRSPVSNDQWGRIECKYQIRINELLHQITNKTKAIVIIQPNNPTGSLLTSNEFEELMDISTKRKITIINDEVFSDYIYKGAINNQSFSRGLVITINGFSKTLCLPQLKYSWLYAEGEKVIVDNFVESMEIITDTYLSVNTIVQDIAPEIFAYQKSLQSQIKQRILDNLEIIDKYCQNSKKIRYHHPDGGWYIVLEIANISDEEYSIQLLNQYGVYVHPGYMFDYNLENCIILSLIVPIQTMKSGIIKILESL